MVEGYLRLWRDSVRSGKIEEAQGTLNHLLRRTVLAADPPPVRSAVAVAGACVVRNLIELGAPHGLALDLPLENLVQFFDSIFDGEEATVEIPDLDLVVDLKGGEMRLVSAATAARIAGARWKVRILDNGPGDKLSEHAIGAGSNEIMEWMLDGHEPLSKGKVSWGDVSPVWRSCFERIWRRAFVEPGVPFRVRRGTGAAGATLVLSLEALGLSGSEPLLERWHDAFGALSEGCRMEIVLAQDDGVILDLEYDDRARRVRASEINEHVADLRSTIRNVEVFDEAPARASTSRHTVEELFGQPGPVRREQKADPVRREQKIGRNEPCPCGSGKKYKKCCG